MTPSDVPEAAVEAVAKGIHGAIDGHDDDGWRLLTEAARRDYRTEARAAIDAFVDAVGLGVEQTTAKAEAYFHGEGAPIHTRFVSRWLPTPDARRHDQH